MPNESFAAISKQLNSNHLEVCQRLTTIETTIKTSREAYGDIPIRVMKLEKFEEKVKIMGSIAGAGIAAGWTALFVWLRKA